TALDSLGNTATGFNGSVIMAIGTNPGASTLSGTASQTAVAGVATFADLSLNRTGTGYTLAASDGALTPVTSSAFNVTPGAATQPAFTLQPTNPASNVAIAPPVQVTAQDGLGNTATAFSGNVTVA